MKSSSDQQRYQMNLALLLQESAVLSNAYELEQEDKAEIINLDTDQKTVRLIEDFALGQPLNFADFTFDELLNTFKFLENFGCHRIIPLCEKEIIARINKKTAPSIFSRSHMTTSVPILQSAFPYLSRPMQRQAIRELFQIGPRSIEVIPSLLDDDGNPTVTGLDDGIVLKGGDGVEQQSIFIHKAVVMKMLGVDLRTLDGKYTKEQLDPFLSLLYKGVVDPSWDRDTVQQLIIMARECNVYPPLQAQLGDLFVKLILNDLKNHVQVRTGKLSSVQVNTIDLDEFPEISKKQFIRLTKLLDLRYPTQWKMRSCENIDLEALRHLQPLYRTYPSKM